MSVLSLTSHALFVCFTITTIAVHQHRRLQVRSRKPTWQHLGHPPSACPPTSSPTYTKVTIVLSCLESWSFCVFFFSPSLPFSNFHFLESWWVYGFCKYRFYAKACQCDYTLRPCGLALPSISREVGNISLKRTIFCQKNLLTNVTSTGRPVTGFLLAVKGDSSPLREERWDKMDFYKFLWTWVAKNIVNKNILQASIWFPSVLKSFDFLCLYL